MYLAVSNTLEPAPADVTLNRRFRWTVLLSIVSSNAFVVAANTGTSLIYIHGVQY